MMKKYKSSDLTHKRAELLKEAKANGVIIQQLETNGEVRQEFVLLDKKSYIDKLMSPDITIDDQYLIANVNNQYKPLDFT